jgi:hypothetical protein
VRHSKTFDASRSTRLSKRRPLLASVCVILSLMARVCYVLKFVGGSVGRGGFSDHCRVATFSVIGSCF